MFAPRRQDVLVAHDCSRRHAASDHVDPAPGNFPTTAGAFQASASGGTNVTIGGTGFTGATAVSFGAVVAAGFTVESDTVIRAVSPARDLGRTRITVTTPRYDAGEPRRDLRVRGGHVDADRLAERLALRGTARPARRRARPAAQRHRDARRADDRLVGALRRQGTNVDEDRRHADLAPRARSDAARRASSFRVDSYGQLTAVAPAVGGPVRVTVVNDGGQATSTESFSPPAPTPPPAPQPPGSLPVPAVVPGIGTAPPRRRGRLSARVLPARELLPPFVFRVSGRLTLPAGVPTAAGCRGRVTVRVQRGDATTIATRRVWLPRSCTYRVRISFATRARLRAAKRLIFRVRFEGNARVPATAAGRRLARVRR